MMMHWLPYLLQLLFYFLVVDLTCGRKLKKLLMAYEKFVCKRSMNLKSDSSSINSPHLQIVAMHMIKLPDKGEEHDMDY
jgi:hypothetical protein